MAYMTVAWMLVANVVLATVYEAFSAQTGDRHHAHGLASDAHRLSGKILKDTKAIRARQSKDAFALLIQLQGDIAPFFSLSPAVHSLTASHQLTLCVPTRPHVHVAAQSALSPLRQRWASRAQDGDQAHHAPLQPA